MKSNMLNVSIILGHTEHAIQCESEFFESNRQNTLDDDSSGSFYTAITDVDNWVEEAVELYGIDTDDAYILLEPISKMFP